MKVFNLLLVVLWVLIVAMTVRAVQLLGSEGGMVFLTDFAHPWRAQFNTDFSIHIVLIALWVFWRERSKMLGAVLALLCAMGGLFTLPYLLYAAYRAQGDVKALLLGAHYRP